MTIRESTENWEENYLSPYAALSKHSKGREIQEPPCDIRPVYQRDRDRILHCKAFRRLNHQMTSRAATLEGRIVRYSDKIAYINHDIDDAIRGGIIRETELPRAYTDILGHSTRERLNTLIHDIVKQSLDKPDICMSEDVEYAFLGMRKYMFVHVYTNEKAKGEELKAENIVKELFHYYMEHPELLPKEYIERMWQAGQTQERSVCDYISGMTDQYAIGKFQEFFIPDSWRY